MFDKYFTPEQMEYLKERADRLGPDRLRAVEAEWPQLMADVRTEMEKGTDPADPRVQELARRWHALVDEFTGGNAGVRQSLGNLYRGEGQVHGMDAASMRPMMEYIARAASSGNEGRG